MRRKTRKDPGSYRQRNYRDLHNFSDLLQTRVQVRETDLLIMAGDDVTDIARDLVVRYRLQLENYISDHPGFVDALLPQEDDPLAPPMVREMLAAGMAAGVGPMAAVAGVLAEQVGRGLLGQGFREVIVENGGDIFINRENESILAVFAGESPLSNRVGIRLKKEQMPCGVCTSSGTVGHSLSLGKADSITVIAASTALADAAATRLGNEAGPRADIDKALETGKGIKGISGVVAICGEKLGAWGEVELLGL